VQELHGRSPEPDEVHETYAYFFKQPETPEEMAGAQRALDVCLTLSISNDG
jgi:hypothetical protein